MLAALNIVASFVAALALAVHSHRLDPHIGGTVNAPWWMRLSLELLSATLAVSAFVQVWQPRVVSPCEAFVNFTLAMVGVAVFAALKSTGARLDQQRERRSA